LIVGGHGDLDKVVREKKNENVDYSPNKSLKLAYDAHKFFIHVYVYFVWHIVLDSVG
jgi:hypothetical protein